MTIFSYGQVSDFMPFNNTDYPSDRYSIKTDNYNFRQFQIELTHVKQIVRDNLNPTSFNCRVWLMIKKGKENIDTLFFKNIDAVGGCSGVYIAPEQPLKDYFILSKFGDYNGEIIIIDKIGNIHSYFGGSYSLSDDNKFLFSIYDSDLSGLTVFDLSQDKLLYSTDSLENRIKELYVYNSFYFATTYTDENKDNDTIHYLIDLGGWKGIIKSDHASDEILKDSKKLIIYNLYLNSPCNCGQTK